jgi:hypothetical protein
VRQNALLGKANVPQVSRDAARRTLWPLKVYEAQQGFYQPDPTQGANIARGGVERGPELPFARTPWRNLQGEMDWKKTTQWDMAMDTSYRKGDTVLVPPYSGYQYPPAYVDGVTIGGTAAFANQIRGAVSVVSNGTPGKTRMWKIVLGCLYTPGTTVRIPLGGGVATASVTGTPDPNGQQSLDPTRYTQWRDSEYFDSNATDPGRGVSGDATLIDSAADLRVLVLTRMENEGSGDVLVNDATQSSPNGSQAAGNFLIGPTRGPIGTGLPGGIIKRVSVPVNGAAVIYAPGRSIDVFAYNPCMNRQWDGTNDGWYIPGLPLIATYTLEEATPGVSNWNDVEEIEVPPDNGMAVLDIPPFCTHFQIISAPAQGTVRVLCATPGGEPSLVDTVVGNPLSAEIRVAPGLIYYLNCTTGIAARVYINYICQG